MRFGLLHIWCFLLRVWFGRCRPSFTDVLQYYETLHPSHVQHKIVRRSAEEESHVRHVTFEAFGREFMLDLIQTNEILASDFEAFEVNNDVRSAYVPVHKHCFYTGHLHQQFDSTVLLHIDSNNLITGLIRTNDDEFHIEPWWRHSVGAGDNRNQMVMYRELDVHSNVTDNIFKRKKKPGVYSHTERNNERSRRESFSQRKGAEHLRRSAEHLRRSGGHVTNSHRSRRNSACARGAEVCTLYLVADYLYFNHVGGGDVERTIHYMLQAITVADNIFTHTDWRSKDVCFNIGFTVKKVIVHKTPSNKTGLRYNQLLKEKYLKNEAMLRFLIEDERGIHDDHICLAHLFTYRDFADGVVGLAFIRSAAGNAGICSERKVALSSNLNFGRPLLTLESNLVTAHELGHNFGAKHDGEDGSGCLPEKESKTGNYLMYNRMLNGKLPNNNKFSPCSIKQIADLLREVPPSCLVERMGTFCGNGIVEGKEECDGGIFKEEDPCCTKDCRLKNQALHNCSDINHICCTNCSFSATTKKCRNRNEFNCIDVTFCDGKSADCPNVYSSLTDNSPCNFGRGNCQKDGCVDVCAQKGMAHCYCEANQLCSICCKNNATGDCVVLVPMKEPNGTLCDDGKGLCMNGECQPIKKEVQTEFAALLEDFSFSKLGRFLKANIVGTILTFSLFVWLPASCIVHLLDKKQDEEDYLIRRWMHPNNAYLLPKHSNRLKGLFKKNTAKAKRVSGARFHISS